MTSCNLHGDCQCECKVMTKESKVVRYAFDTTIDYVNGAEYHQMVSDNSGPFVTHADYRALEEERARFERLADANYRMYQAAKEELAALRGKVGELVEADRDYGKAILMPGLDAVNEAGERRHEAMQAFL